MAPQRGRRRDTEGIIEAVARQKRSTSGVQESVAAQQDLDPTPTAANARDHPDPALKCPVPVYDGFRIERPLMT
jgi:hypothetical protein